MDRKIKVASMIKLLQQLPEDADLELWVAEDYIDFYVPENIERHVRKLIDK